jgi:outer membrane immunogenic protein
MFLIAAAVATAAISPAVAQNVSSSNGFKVGVFAGCDNVNLKYDGESGSKGGFLYGVTAGYDVNLGGAAVVGLELKVAIAPSRKAARSMA